MYEFSNYLITVFVLKALTSQPDQVDKLLNLRQEDQVKCALILGTDAHKESKCIEAICQYLQEK